MEWIQNKTKQNMTQLYILYKKLQIHLKNPNGFLFLEVCNYSEIKSEE